MLFYSFSFMIFPPTVPVSAWVGDGSVMNKKGDSRNMDTVRPRETSGWSGEQSWKAMRRLKRSSSRTTEVSSQEPDSTSYWEQKPSTALRRAEGGEQSWKAMRRLKKSSSRTPEVRSQEPGVESREQSWKAMRRLKKSLSQTPEASSNFLDSSLYLRELPSDWIPAWQRLQQPGWRGTGEIGQGEWQQIRLI